MTTSFESLSAIGTELSGDQLDDVDGGFVMAVLVSGYFIALAMGLVPSPF